MRPDGSRLAATLLALFSGGQAEAHGALPGSEGFYTGIAHVFQEPALLLALGVTILALMPDWPNRYRSGIVVFATGLALGLLLGRSLTALLPLEFALLLIAMIAGAAIALLGDRATGAIQVPIAALGLLIGAACLPDPGDPVDVLVTTTGGVSVPLVAILAVGGAYDGLSNRLRGQGLSTALRIASAWLCAIAAMLAALVFRGNGWGA